VTTGQLKNEEIPVLDCYDGQPNVEFWSKFPANHNINKIESKVNIENLKFWISKLESKLTASQKHRANKTVEFFEKGAPAYQKSTLPSCFVKNAGSTKNFGPQVSDNIASWIKKGFACGPFINPPFKKFRVNPIIAIPQSNKIRIVLNVSMPEGQSFNDNIDDNSLEKVHMSSARNFGFILKKCGKNAKFSKSDLNDAYKLIPALTDDLWLQGFFWNGRFFCEKSQIFGARSAVCNFDVGGNTVNTLAIVHSNTDPEFVCRHLDDTSNAGSCNSSSCENFTAAYKEICESLNIPTAPDCPKFEKAFSNSTRGKVLGIIFDSKSLTWSLPQDKKVKITYHLHKVLNSPIVETTIMQKLMGYLNYVSLMCPFLSGFRRNLFDDLAFSTARNLPTVRISEVSRRDLRIWAGVILDPDQEFPIPSMPCSPPLFYKEFVSDAAGFADNCSFTKNIGVASLGFTEDGNIFFAKRVWWDPLMIKVKTDVNGKRFGNKTTMLETIGCLMPFVCTPASLRNQHVVLKVDNIACHEIWKKRYCKEDVYSSILVRCIHLLSNFLCCIVHIQHCPRRSTWSSCRVDDMSRESTSSTNDDILLSSIVSSPIPVCLTSWIYSPTVDWNLPMKLLSEVRRINNM